MISLSAVQEALHRLFIDAAETRLRDEDRKKAAELVGILAEVGRAVAATSPHRPTTLVDAAAGKAYVGLLAAEFVLAPAARPGRVILIERDARRAASCRNALARLRAPGITAEVVEADVADSTAWPMEPDVVVALHACGPASDAVVERATISRARNILLVPCCTSEEVVAAELAERQAEALGIPRQAEVRRRFIQAIVDAERTLRLEAAGYETVVVSFVPPTLTPHNLLWRARRVGEPMRMAQAADRLRRLREG
jgi:hypothetical protein